MAESNIKVAVRMRPSFKDELIIEKEITEEKSIRIKDTCFTFDYVFNELKTTEDIYKLLITDRIKSLFEGMNCTILAYGSTGSGKTFTMGTLLKENTEKPLEGLIHLGIKDIFKYAQSIAGETEVIIKATFFEIYLETIKDLLKSKSIFFPGDSKEAKITNMTERVVSNSNEAIQALEKGIKARTTGATQKNSKSSRSHAFFIMSLIMTDKKSGRSIFSKFQLVDLAGSERAGVDATGQELKQGIQINKGLTALGRVISSLSQREKHIPYRDSILTRYLRDSFGGNSYTVMVTCISPAQANVEETLSSLRYSLFAKKIKNIITVNRDSTDLIEHLKLEVERLKKMKNCAEKETLTNQINYLNECLVQGENNLDVIKEKMTKFFINVQSLEENMILKSFHDERLNPYLVVLNEIKEDLYKFFAELDEKKSSFLQDKNLQDNNNSSALLDILKKPGRESTSGELKETYLENRIAELELKIEGYNNKTCPIKAEDVPALEEDIEAINYLEKGLVASVELTTSRYEIRYIKSLLGKKYGFHEEALSKTQNGNEQAKAESIEENLVRRIKSCENNLNVYEDNQCVKAGLLKPETCVFLLEHLISKFSMLTTAPISVEYLDKYNIKKPQDPNINRERDLEKKVIALIQGKKNMELIHQKKIVELNKQWNQKIEALKNASIKEDEVSELKEKLKVLEEENKKLRCAQLQLPSTSRAKGPKKKLEEKEDSMIEIFLSEDEKSFMQESEILDPDYRATPLWKRNKLKSKRKLPEDGSTLSSSTPPKIFSPPGCNCPNDCSTIRCRCKKRRLECNFNCECIKGKCMNTSSTESF